MSLLLTTFFVASGQGTRIAFSIIIRVDQLPFVSTREQHVTKLLQSLVSLPCVCTYSYYLSLETGSKECYPGTEEDDRRRGGDTGNDLSFSDINQS